MLFICVCKLNSRRRRSESAISGSALSHFTGGQLPQSKMTQLENHRRLTGGVQGRRPRSLESCHLGMGELRAPKVPNRSHPPLGGVGGGEIPACCAGSSSRVGWSGWRARYPGLSNRALEPALEQALEQWASNTTEQGGTA